MNHYFPKDFLWGASTASHQVEGNTNNQWSQWETQHAAHLATTADTRLGCLPNWQQNAPAGRNTANYLSGNGVEHYTRYREDFAILKQLGMNAFRFSFEWSRIEPSEGQWNEDALAHYRSYIAELRHLDIEPIPTLWHWTTPIWFAKKGGFARRQNVQYFRRFAEKIGQEYGADFTHLLTINEPTVYATHSYALGLWPPQCKSPITALQVTRNLVLAHQQAYAVLKEFHPHLSIGHAAQLADSRPTNPHNPLNQLGVVARSYAWNWWFLDRVRQQSDFIGVNYYFTEYVDWRQRTRNPTKPLNDLGWYMEPSGLRYVLENTWHRYKKPIVITENGLADASDEQRTWWLDETLQAIDQALAGGAQIKGYLHWSLLDNFEWAYGWWPKFGLVAVDRETMKRSPRTSALHLAKMIAEQKKSS